MCFPFKEKTGLMTCLKTTVRAAPNIERCVADPTPLLRESCETLIECQTSLITAPTGAAIAVDQSH
jgi:hypothetical protein